MSHFGTISSLPTIPTPADDGTFARRKPRSWQETVAGRTSGQSEPKLEQLGEILPPTSGQVELKSMTFRELDQAIDTELCRVRDRLIPYLLRMRELLSDQGKRTDLPSDVPKKLMWQAWIESKKTMLGSISTVNRMLREAYDQEHKKNACAECGKIKGHKTTCSKYDPPDPEPLTPLEKKFVGSAVQQHETLKDFYAGRLDADAALKTFVSTIPTHQALEEYTSRGADGIEDEANENVDEGNEKLEEQEKHIAETEPEITGANAENGTSQQQLTELDSEVTGKLAAEPDTAAASKVLTDYLATSAQKVLPAHMMLSVVHATVRYEGRDHRIMVGDYLEKQTKGTTAKTLCKCTGIGQCEQRRRVREWDGKSWGKEHVVYSSDESYYRVIGEEAARRLAPEAFESEGL